MRRGFTVCFTQFGIHIMLGGSSKDYSPFGENACEIPFQHNFNLFERRSISVSD